MAKFKGAVLECQICGKPFKVPRCRVHKATTCSHECSVVYRANSLKKDKVHMVCPACGITFLVHQSQSVYRKYCSRQCKEQTDGLIARQERRSRGENNGMWKGGTSARSDGYVYENSYAHPFAAPNGYVLQHRLVMEQHLRRTNPDSSCLVRIEDNVYLRPDLVVHHKNFDRKDNRIENLEVLSNGDHQRLHNQLRRNPK